MRRYSAMSDRHSPAMIMMTATTGVTFALGIVVSLGLVMLGFGSFTAVNHAMDIAIYYGLPAAAGASYCASVQNRLDRA